MKISFFVALPLFLSVTSGTFAETVESAPSDESILELMELMEVEQILDQTIQSMESMMEMAISQSLATSGASKKDFEEAEKVREVMMEWLEEELSYDFLIELYVPSYRETFTQVEVDQLIEFFSGPVGQMLIRKQPELMNSFLQKYQSEIGPMMERFQTKLTESL
ncbi:MAG: DUF2059 domain-containing protein [Verrucomicrobiota bacterium]